MIKKVLFIVQTAGFCSCLLLASEVQAGDGQKKKAKVSKIIAKTAKPSGDSTTTSDLTELSLEDLMNVKVVSASKKAESAFDAPLSIGSINRDEIKRSGVTNIPEALKLIPGLLVTEQTNGNYDVSIRGLNNLPLNSSLHNATNSITLVMIDNRPVYNYFSGGTFWETLPVDLNDIERIEVVRGPAQALYGPNAASGVINIITRRAQKEGLYAVANVQGGLSAANVNGKAPGTYLGNASVGYKKGKFDFIISGNYQNRSRTTNQYYDWTKDQSISKDDLRYYLTGDKPGDANDSSNINQRYPNPNSSQVKYGYNAFANYSPNEKVNIGVSLGGQNSSAQVAYIENLVTPLSTRTSNTNYADIKAKIYGLNAQVAYQGGTQDASVGFPGYKYNFGTLDAIAEYDIKLGNFLVKPGINYRNANYNDSPYINTSLNQGFINGSKTLTDLAGSLRAEYDDKKFFRVVAAARLDQYNVPTKPYLSYEFAGYVKPSENHLIRLVYSRAFRGPTMYDMYSSQNLTTGYHNIPGLGNIPSYGAVTGNTSAKLQQIDMVELGYRAKATEYLHFDVDLFYQVSRNYNLLVQGYTGPNDNLNAVINGNAPSSNDFAYIYKQSFEGLNLVAYQKGATISANLVLKKFQIKPFVTLQYTNLTGSPTVRDSATVNLNTSNIGDPKNTPAVFGGFYANYQPTSKWNINFNGYFFSQYTYTNIYSSLGGYIGYSNKGSTGTVNVLGKFQGNLKIGYKITDKVEVFINARNLFNTTTYEFAHTDPTSGLYMIGGSFEF